MAIEHKTDQQQKSNLFQLLMFRYFPYWPLFLGLSILLLTLAWGYLQIASPVYETTATIIIKDEKKGVEDPRMMESLNMYTSKKIVENEIEVIKSKTLMRQTVEKLHLSAPVLKKGKFLSYSAYTSSPVSVEVKDINKIKEVEKQEFSYNAARNAVTLNNKEYLLDEWIKTQFGEIRFVKNKFLTEQEAGPFYFSLIDPRKVSTELLKILNVAPASKLSTVANLSIKDAVPARAENILNTLLDSYNKAAITDKNNLVENTLAFVEDRIRSVEHDLDSVERNIQQFKSTRGIVDLSEQGKLFLQNVGDNDQKLSELNMQLAVLDKAEEYVVKKNNATGIIPSTIGINDAALSVLIQKLYNSEIQYERLKKTTAENNPILLSIQNEIQSMRPGILENIQSQRSSLAASRTNLLSTNDKYSSVLKSIPQKERELLEVNRQQAIKNNVYNFLLQKREETALSYASKIGDSRLVDKAETSVKPVAPKKILIYAVAIALAFAFGMASILAKELLSNKVLFRADIETNTRIPILAEISHTSAKNFIVINSPKKEFITEQFRQLRAEIGLYGKTSKKTIMVTSMISGEGKSFVSANFASSLAQTNRKILLIDLDLRKPRISKFFNLGGTSGMAEILNGTEKVEDVIRTTETSNLFVIGAGKDLMNPTETLLNGNIRNMFEQLREMFDYIIVDTAPLYPVTDAYVISPYCDETLFVLRHGKTSKSMVQLLDSNQKIKSMKNLSIVFNGVKTRGFVKSDFGYGYGHGYGYEYLERSRSKKLLN